MNEPAEVTPIHPEPTAPAAAPHDPRGEIVHRLAAELKLKDGQVDEAVKLFDVGFEPHFVATYQKEKIGGLGEHVLRALHYRLTALRRVEYHRTEIRRALERCNALNAKLDKRLHAVWDVDELDDLQRAFGGEPSVITGPDVNAGLEPLADTILKSRGEAPPLGEAAAPFVRPGTPYSDAASVLQGAMRIMAERIANDPEIRRLARRAIWKHGRLVTAQGSSPTGEFAKLVGFDEPLSRLSPYKALTIVRGGSRQALSVDIAFDRAELTSLLQKRFLRRDAAYPVEVNEAIGFALDTFLIAAIKADVRRQLAHRASEYASEALTRNLRALLMTHPLNQRRALAIHPDTRAGWQLAALDAQGAVLQTATVAPTDTAQPETLDAQIAALAQAHEATLLVIGTAAAGGEVEDTLARLIAGPLSGAEYAIVPETAASAYASSRRAAKELPGLAIPMRYAVSLGRRALDPMSEYLKAPLIPLAMGLQRFDIDHAIAQAHLDAEARACVAAVGLNLREAPTHLLARAAGFDDALARAVVAQRRSPEGLDSREALRRVKGMMPEIWYQAAPYLFIEGGPEPLDATRIHPDRYGAARQILEEAGIAPADLLDPAKRSKLRDALRPAQPTAELAGRLGLSEAALGDTLAALPRAGLDPRRSRPGPPLRKRPLELEEMQPGQPLRGVVRNVVEFGAFVDVGARQDGLVHVTHLADRFVRQPCDVAALGDVVTVWIDSIDLDKRRLSLTLLRPGRQSAPQKRHRPTQEPKPQEDRQAERPPRRAPSQRPPRPKTGPQRPRPAAAKARPAQPMPKPPPPPRETPDGNMRMLLERAGLVAPREDEKRDSPGV